MSLVVEKTGASPAGPQIYAEKNDVTITYEGGHQEITANREMINELINNLCANAIRYNKKNGSVKVRVDSSQGHPYISVADTGIGISSNDQKKCSRNCSEGKMPLIYKLPAAVSA